MSPSGAGVVSETPEPAAAEMRGVQPGNRSQSWSVGEGRRMRSLEAHLARLFGSCRDWRGGGQARRRARLHRSRAVLLGDEGESLTDGAAQVLALHRGFEEAAQGGDAEGSHLVGQAPGDFPAHGKGRLQ